jgi:hypothetical protein
MQEIIEKNGKQIILDTECDPCLFAAPDALKKKPKGAFIRGKDLNVHETEDGIIFYYLVLWSLKPLTTE